MLPISIPSPAFFLLIIYREITELFQSSKCGKLTTAPIFLHPLGGGGREAVIEVESSKIEGVCEKDVVF